MRVLLGLAGLLVVVFVIAQLARAQVQALHPAVPASGTEAGTVHTPQQQVIDELSKALEAGSQRAASAGD
ncbi:MAG: hypothetical protein LC125_06330 [Burkholderiales bacterium]|nr:hypothetical protein [Burkholderiales bacterium]